jgi:hypothetical protein
MIITVKTLQQKTFKIEIDDAENVRPFSSVVVGRGHSRDSCLGVRLRSVVYFYGLDM